MASHNELVSLLDKLDAESFTDEAERLRIKDALQRALRKASTAFEVSQEHVNWYLTEIAVVRSLIFAGVFQHWAQNGSEKMTCQELAKLTGADVALLSKPICLHANGLT